MTKPGKIWIYLRASIWFLPSLIVAVGIVLALDLIEMAWAVMRHEVTRRVIPHSQNRGNTLSCVVEGSAQWHSPNFKQTTTIQYR
jgi:uncharacterized membrane protein